MNPACVQAVQGAIGRPITAGEARGIEQRVRDGMVAVARQDPAAWQALSTADRLALGAKHAADELVAEAQKKKQRIALTILRHDFVENYAAAQVAAGDDATKLDALNRLIAFTEDGKANSTSAESNAKGILGAAMGRLTDAWEAIQPNFLGVFANHEAEAQFLRALHGDTAGVRPEIIKAAKVWLDEAELLRQRWNAAGGDTGKLDNWGVPHGWDHELTLRAGKDAFVDHMMRLVDRRRYVHEDGTAYTDTELSAFLGEAWVTIVTNGANKPVRAGAPGGSIKANRGSHTRQIHFKDGAAATEALRAYSGGNVFEAMFGHVNKIARDIALVEQFGPNADLAVSHFIERFKMEEANANPGGASKLENKIRNIERRYNYVAGNSEPPANLFMAKAFGALRSWLSSAMLGSASVTSISDVGSLYLTGKVNNLPMHKLFLNDVAAFNPADRVEARIAQRAGLMAHSMAESMDRFGNDTMGSHIPQKVASTVIRASGLLAMTNAHRRAFSLTFMDTIGALTRDYRRVDQLDPQDWKLLRSKGITDAEWAVWRAAEPESHRGNDTLLTPESIYAIPDATIAAIAPGVPPSAVRERAASKLLAVILEEQDMAIITPGARERVMLGAGLQRGTWTGELVRTLFLFKSFPIANIARHWGRGLKMYDRASGKAGYVGLLVASQTIMGALALEINDILSGKDPRSLNPASEHGGKNWLAAVLKGGSLGLYGDFLFGNTTGHGQSLWATVAGPGGGLVEDAMKLTVGNAREAAEGKETHFGAEAVKMADRYTPGSSLWYAKAALDRLAFHQMQEYFSPGYLARAKAKARREYGTTYWWDPGASPDQARPVDVANVIDDR